MKWISIKQLPPKFKNVLAISKKGVMAITCVDNSGKLDNFHLEVDGKDYYTHWLPLPLSPNESPIDQLSSEAGERKFSLKDMTHSFRAGVIAGNCQPIQNPEITKQQYFKDKFGITNIDI